MHNTVLFIFILAILGGCAGSPDSPASTRVDCPDDLYLPAHKPDECGQEAPAEISVLQGGDEGPVTWKLSIGDGVSYERATFLGERKDFALLRKLGGNLLLVPTEALSR